MLMWLLICLDGQVVTFNLDFYLVLHPFKLITSVILLLLVFQALITGLVIVTYFLDP